MDGFASVMLLIGLHAGHCSLYHDGVLLVCVTVRGGLSLQNSKDSIAFYFPELQDENGGPMREGE